MASELISPLLRELVSKVKEELGLLYGVGDELRDFSRTISYIESVVADAEERHTTERVVKEWLDDLKNVFYDADDLLDECRYEALRRKSIEADGIIQQVCNFFLSCLLLKSIRFRGNVAHRIKEIKKRVDKILRDGKRFKLKEKLDGENRQNSDIVRRPPSSSVIHKDSQSEFIGRDDDIKEIMNRLMSDEHPSGGGGKGVPVISIVGMGGLGKTTLAQLVYNNENVQQHFQVTAWACVSETFDILRLTKEIIESATEESNNSSAIDSAQRKLKKILSGKRFLIVLDDVWNTEPQDWDGLRPPFSFGAEGSKILVTTRNEKVSKTMLAEIYRLRVLSDGACWSLFERHAFAGGDNNADPELIKIGRELVKERCKGLPLAVKVLGRLLCSRKEPSYWKRILGSQLWSSVEGESSELMNALRVSYHHLPPRIKNCFAFCSIFPKDHAFEKDALVEFWMAQGFIQPIDGMQMSLVETVSDCFDFLLSRSFFQEYRNNWYIYYKMHDCIHDLAMLVSSGECFSFESGNSSLCPRNDCRHFSFIRRNTMIRTEDFLRFYECKDLRTLFLPNVKIIGGDLNRVTSDWIVNLRCLRLLVLKHSAFSGTAIELPCAISNLIHLRCLDLSWTNITQLPESVSSLYHLETLNLENCYDLCQLPKETRKLVNLRHLNLNGCRALERMPPEMGKLTCLQTLSRFIVGRERGCGIGQLKGLRALKGQFSIGELNNVSNAEEAEEANLKGKTDIDGLVLSWPDEDYTNHDRALLEEQGKILEALQPHTNIKSLFIGPYGGLNYPRWLQHTALPNLVELDLYWFRNCNSIPPLGRLQVKLSIGYNDNLEEWCEPPEGGEFLSLRTLRIVCCPKLRTMPNYFSTLKSLSLYECLQLACLPYSPSLYELCLSCCNEILLSQVSLLTSLSTLTIKNFKELKSLPGDMLQHLGNLKELTIWHCPELLSLPDGVSRIPSLLILGCPKLRTTSPDELGEGTSSGG